MILYHIILKNMIFYLMFCDLMLFYVNHDET